MLANLSAIFSDILSVLMSLLLSFGSLTGSIVPPTTNSPADYQDGNIKNVIYLIGDGMGYNHWAKTKQERGIELTVETFDYMGNSMTRSISDAVTDSAASGTALATGTRTYNGAIGVYFDDPFETVSRPMNITELCMERGMMTGVVTTDETTGATPSAFSAHSSDRGNTEDLTNDQLTSGIDLIWGANNGVATKRAAMDNGYTYVTTYDEMMALEEGSRSYAQFTNDLWTLEQSDENTPNLEQMTEKAIDLLDDTEEGFFLMVEGAHIDKHSHSNLDEEMTEAMEEFDRTVQLALEYAEEDGETLVIVTADHETGAITLNDDGTYSFTSGSHSAANVAICVYGTDKIIATDETINNYEIPIRVAYVLGFDETQFPREIMVA